MEKNILRTPAIEANGLSKNFGNFTAVDSVSFHVARGEIFGFLGPNGSGKTTTIRMLLGLLTPTSGEAIVLGVPLAGQARAIRSRVGYMSQRFSLYNDLTVTQNLRFYGAAYGLSNQVLEEGIERTLAMAGLQERERTKTRLLSGGWRQRLALGAAILHQPEVLFLDEPTAGVDPLSRREFWDLLYQLVESGVTVLVTTHYMDEAEHCHRLAFIQRGRLIALGMPAELKSEAFQGRVLQVESDNAVEAVRALRAARGAGAIDLTEIELYGSLVHAVSEDPQAEAGVRSTLEQAGLATVSILEIEPSLEDIFITCMQAGQDKE